MRYFLDTEFIDDGKTIDLISIGIVADDGREYYAINSNCDLSKASPWLKENVIAQLPPRNPFSVDFLWPIHERSQAWKRKEVIAIEVLCFIKQIDLIDTPCGDYRKLARSPLELWTGGLFGVNGFAKHPQPGIQDLFHASMDETPEIWAYYADYDWVAFCQLFGTMMDLPKGFPMYCRDIKQECDRLGNPELPKQKSGCHNALEDARHNRELFTFLRKLDTGRLS